MRECKKTIGADGGGIFSPAAGRQFASNPVPVSVMKVISEGTNSRSGMLPQSPEPLLT